MIHGDSCNDKDCNRKQVDDKVAGDFTFQDGRHADGEKLVGGKGIKGSEHVVNGGGDDAEKHREDHDDLNRGDEFDEELEEQIRKTNREKKGENDFSESSFTAL